MRFISANYRFGSALVFVVASLSLTSAARMETVNQSILTTPALDEFMSKLGGSIPFPPQKMVETLDAQGISVYGSTIVPRGRSLERRSTTFAQPRSMVSFYLGDPKDTHIDASKFVFVAYTPLKNELEIIAGSASIPNGFFIVPNYQAGNDHAVPIPPQQGNGLCLACHQNGGPIFSEPSWHETAFDPDVRNLLQSQTGLDPFAQWLLTKYLKDDSNRPTPNGTLNFDFSVRFAAQGHCSFNCTQNRDLDLLRPISALVDREVLPRTDSDFTSQQDPLTPRLSEKYDDPYAHPSPSWTISLSRDGSESFPTVSPGNLFKMYCSSCHAGPNSVAPRLPLDDLNALATYWGTAFRTVRGLLGNKTMPPINSRLPSPEDRQRMLDALPKVR